MTAANERYAAASTSMVYALRDAAIEVWRRGGRQVNTEHFMYQVWRRSESLRRLAPLPKQSFVDRWALNDVDSDVGTSSGSWLAEFEADATLHEASWQAKRRLRRAYDVAAPEWTAGVRAALVRTFAESAATRTTRYPGRLLIFRALTSDVHSRASAVLMHAGVDVAALFADERIAKNVFVNDAPSTGAIIDLQLSNLLAGQIPPGRASFARFLTWATSGRKGWYGPTIHAVLREANRMAARADSPDVEQSHILLALCSIDFHLAATGKRLVASAVPINRGGAILAENGADYLRVVDYRNRAAPEAALPASSVLWRWHVVGNPPYSAGLAAVEAAADLARRLGHRSVGTSHLLYVIASDEASEGHRMLQYLNVGADRVAGQLATELEIRNA